MKITDIITQVNCQYGAPMGRANIGKQPVTVTSGKNCHIVKKNQVKVYEKKVHIIDGYDIGGIYWGYPSNLYVRFTKDLSYIEYVRK
jgi:DUF971 family protein